MGGDSSSGNATTLWPLTWRQSRFRPPGTLPKTTQVSSDAHRASKEGFGGLLIYDRQPNKLTGSSQSPSNRPPSSPDNTQCDDVGREENS
ncbi:hypothetical protein OXX79_006152 [Metschnikowia pulcherrima]